MLTGDVRNLLRRTTSPYDIVVLSTAEPSTLLASRLLTRESFAEAKRALRPGGVLAFALPGAENYYSPELVARNGAVYKALASVFAHVVVTPLSTNYFLASDAPLSRDPVELARRLRERKVTATFVDEYSLAVLMPEERVQSLSDRYRDAAVAASSDRLPTAYLHNLLVSGRVDPGRVADLLRWALGLGFWALALGLAVLLVVPALVAARGRKLQRPALLVVSVVGFSSMASAVLILAVTQSALGALHHLLGALLAANMAGSGPCRCPGSALRHRALGCAGCWPDGSSASASAFARLDAGAASRDDGRPAGRFACSRRSRWNRLSFSVGQGRNAGGNLRR